MLWQVRDEDADEDEDAEGKVDVVRLGDFETSLASGREELGASEHGVRWSCCTNDRGSRGSVHRGSR